MNIAALGGVKRKENTRKLEKEQRFKKYHEWTQTRILDYELPKFVILYSNILAQNCTPYIICIVSALMLASSKINAQKKRIFYYISAKSCREYIVLLNHSLNSRG